MAGGNPTWTRTTPAIGHSPARPLGLKVYLAPRGGQPALNAAVHDVSTPGNASFRHFLTPAQYRARFEPTAASVGSVTNWLRSAGLKVTGVEPARRYIEVAASVAQAEKAFGTTINTYRHEGQTVVAPARAATIPASIASAVAAVSGLDTTVHAARHNASPSPFPPAFVNARPCSLTYGQLQAKYKADFRTKLPKFQGAYRDYAVCGYVPVQLRTAYEKGSALDGTGATVAIVDAYAAPTIASDANTYASRHGDPTFSGNQFSQHNSRTFTNQDLCGPSGWAGEETLDVEAVHGMAPGADVRYYGAQDCLDQSLAAALEKVVDENKASIVTNSYGEPDQAPTPDVIVANEQAFQQGALQGIGFFFSSGDNGDEVSNTGLLQTDYPASDPYVTAVGGTSTAIDAAGALAFATGWGTDKYNLSTDGASWTPIPGKFLYGSGGGYSTLFNQPDYQNGVVPANAPAGRAVPDLAMDADPTTGMLVGETQVFPTGNAYGEYRIGGTSLASPLMAGIQALATQSAGGRLGFANPAIYKAAGGPTFTDITPVHHGDANVRPDYVNGLNPAKGIKYSIRTFDNDSSLFTARGWDDVTGVGSPNASYLTSQVSTH